VSIEIKYPGAIIRESVIPHPMRPRTDGCTWHWTAGHEPGDVVTLDGPNVDVHFYCAKDGDVYQFLDPRSVAWHAMHTANYSCVGVEMEQLTGEGWTAIQTEKAAELGAWISTMFGIPIKHVDPPSDWHGHFGHKDLSVGGPQVDGNTHLDTVPKIPGWDRFLAMMNSKAAPAPPPPTRWDGDTTLRLAVGGKLYAGWENAAGPIAWIAKNGLKDPKAAIAFKGNVWRGPEDVTNVAKNLAKKYLS
jgi:N-acetyl-anhydromuramyl-L-alanine amidase AmpD